MNHQQDADLWVQDSRFVWNSSTVEHILYGQPFWAPFPFCDHIGLGVTFFLRAQSFDKIDGLIKQVISYTFIMREYRILRLKNEGWFVYKIDF